MNDAMAHTLLSSKGHIGVMTGGLPSMNTCGHLHQLQVVVCPEGLNQSLESLLFNFKELPLWSMANADESINDRCGPEQCSTQDFPSTRAEDPLSLNLRGMLEQLQWASPAAPTLLCNTSLQGHNHLQQLWELFPQLGKQKILPGL